MHVLGRRAFLAVLLLAPLVSMAMVLCFTGTILGGGTTVTGLAIDKRWGFVGDKFRLWGYASPRAKVWIYVNDELETVVEADETGRFEYTWIPKKPGEYWFKACNMESYVVIGTHPRRDPPVTVYPEWVKMVIPIAGIAGAIALYKILKKRVRHLVPAVVVALVLLSLLHVWPALSSLPSWVAVGCGCGENETSGDPSIETYKKLGFVGDRFYLYGYSDEPNQEVRIGGWRDGIKEHVDIAVVVSDENRFWSYTWTSDKPGFYTLFACTEEKCSRHPVEITVLPSWVKYAILAAAAVVGAVALRYAVRWRSKR